MKRNLRAAVLAVAFATTVAAAFTATSFSGQTREMSLAESCARAAWPMIPAACLDGATHDSVRYVSADPSAEARALRDRFEIAFE
jgi:hypothetical protein